MNMINIYRTIVMIIFINSNTFVFSEITANIDNKLKIFDWKFYLKIYSKLIDDDGIVTKRQAIQHYRKYGYKENRWINLHEKPSIYACIHVLDILSSHEFANHCTYPIFNPHTLEKRLNTKLSKFDWKFYLHYNPDMKSKNITTQGEALHHYKRYGFYEKRWSHEREVPSSFACNLLQGIDDVYLPQLSHCDSSVNNNNNNSSRSSSKVSIDNNIISNNIITYKRISKQMLIYDDMLRGFNWTFYLQVNSDLNGLYHIKTEKQAINHYLKHGFQENRWCNIQHKPSITACLLAKNYISINQFNQHCDYLIFHKDEDMKIIKKNKILKSDSTNDKSRLGNNNIAITNIKNNNNSINNNDHIKAPMFGLKLNSKRISSLSSKSLSSSSKSSSSLKSSLSSSSLSSSSIDADEFIHQLGHNLNGCRYVFIDIGDHVGMYIRYLYEPFLYTGRKGKYDYASIYFDNYFMKDRNRSDICAVAIEPNDNRRERNEMIHQYYRNKNLRVYFIYTGISNFDGSTKTYYHNSKNVENNLSLIKREDNDIAIELPVMNLLRFIRYNISTRYIPEKKYNVDPLPTVIMKMNMKGEEMDNILSSLIDSGALCDINVLTIEWPDNLSIDNKHGSVTQFTLKKQLRKLKKTCHRFRYSTFYKDDRRRLR